MKTNKPRVVCHEVKAVGAPVTLKFIVREDVADEYMSTLSERHPVVSSSPLIRISDYEALQAECEKLRKDAERIEWLEEQTKKSWTGISFDYHRYAEDGYVVNHGYRFMGRHFASGFEDSLRKAIDAAMEAQK